MKQKDPTLAEKLHPKYEFTKAEVIWAIHEEMAQELNKDETWEKEQIKAFNELADGYILD